jgi:adenine-specific DNA-methyltransferase
MPTLTWIGKQAVINHHRQVPYRLLHCDDQLSAGDRDAGNLLVQGDNLEALKALLPYYAGQVQCIYIDPPYNTGVDERDEEGKRTGWIYSDNVDSPEMRNWLNRVVGIESEDLSRHDKWLCMMYPRVAILREFLRDEGVIFVSIEENEYGSLRMILDEIFGIPNRVGTIIWKNANDNNPTNIAIEHEYVLCYARNKQKVSSVWKAATLEIKERLLQISDDFIKKYGAKEERQKQYTKWFRENRHQIWPFQDYKFIDDGGIFTGMRSVHNPGKEGYRYDVPHPITKKPCQQPMMGYRFPPETMDQLLTENRIIFGKDDTKIIELKVYVRDYRAKLSSLYELDGRVGTNELKDIFPEDKRPFDFPKPTALIEELLSFATSGDDLVLDSFAGSGTTGHAVMKLNRSDGQQRRFILVEMKESIAKSITAERLKRVVLGYNKKNKEFVKGVGHGFRFCGLGDTLFSAQGNIGESVSFTDLAAHVFFTETGVPIPRRATGKMPLLGIHEGKAVYLLFNGVLGDKKPNGGNVLTSKVLANLPEHTGLKIIYGEGCLLSAQRRKREGIVFKQVPYEIKVS